MKRILAMVLAGILVVSVIPAFAAAEVGSATDKGSSRQLGTTAEGEENPPTEAQSGELPAALNLKYKAKKKLVLANTQPEGLPVNVTWASDNAGIAAVDKNGLVTAKSAGKCTVSAVFPSGSRTEANFRPLLAAVSASRTEPSTRSDTVPERRSGPA